MVYSFHPEVTDSLAQWHVKDSGTVANTQLNLRSLMEGFSDEEITRMNGKVAEKIAYFESQKVASQSFDQDRKKEWVVSDQKDYVSLQRFKRFLEFIEKIKTGTPEEVEALQQQMVAEVEGLERAYFFKDLPRDDYKCLYVPQGGGRREIGLIGKYHLGKHRQKVAEFREKYLNPDNPIALVKLSSLKKARGFSPDTSMSESESYERALSGLESPSQAIRDFERAQQESLNGIREKIRQAVYRGSRDVESIVRDVIIESLDQILGKNIPGILKKQVAAFLGEKKLASAAKILERGPFRTVANKLRSWEGQIRRWVVEDLADPILEGARGVQRKFENRSLELAERMLNDISKKGAFEPHIALAEMGWSFGDVLTEDDFPAQNYISIDMDKDGELMLGSLENKLEKIKEDLHEFPELFELYCSSIILIFNDPHNPTSKVADPKTKLKLLDIASKYGLAILADEAYHKMIEKDLKEEEGDISLASFYNQNRDRFPRPVTIYSSLPSTKWGMGAGRRSGNILTNDLETHPIMIPGSQSVSTTFEEFVRQNTDGVNTMSLWFDQETLSAGLAVKKVCKPLEEMLLNPLKNPVSVMDEILKEMVQGIDSPAFQGPIYFKLLAARNDMDRLMIREAGTVVMRQYVSDLVSSLKEMRLDKQTRKDTESRVAAGVKAVTRLSKKIPGLEERYIKPEGPFYLCVEFDETKKDSGLRPFIEAFAKARGVDGVHVGKGDVRFSFGGMLDGTPESYEMLSVGFEKSLELSLRYWEEFKEIRRRLNASRDSDPTYNALQELFPANGNVAKDTLGDREQMVYFHQLLGESGSQDILKKIARELVKRKPGIKKLNGKSELGDVLNAVPEQDMALILDYLKKYKLLKAHLDEQGDEDSEMHAMQQTFEGIEQLPVNPEALRVLMNNFPRYKEKGKVPLVFTVSSDASKYVSHIQPDSQASIVTIRGVKCPDMKTFIESEPFQTLFNFYLLKIKDKIPKLKDLTDGEVLGKYEALRFAEKVRERKFEKGEKKLFAQIAMEIAKIWYSDDTTKVLAENFEGENSGVQAEAKRALEQSLEGVSADIRARAMRALTDSFRPVSPDVQRKAMIGTAEMVNRYIKEFLQVFITEEQERSLQIKPTFQVGYQSIRGVKANSSALPWMKKLVESAEFAGQTVPTDPAPEMTTGGTARVAGFDYGIYRRDGDGENAPQKEYFRERLTQFMEKMNPKDYVCKMVQIGPVRTLLVMNRSYTHYMAEE
ncbi:MAG: aminotransferase class I/II-fold pyridoxal phosphate-dependent enzyme, partial [Candidatus Gracilibacteria bacterium]